MSRGCALDEGDLDDLRSLFAADAAGAPPDSQRGGEDETADGCDRRACGGDPDPSGGCRCASDSGVASRGGHCHRGEKITNETLKRRHAGMGVENRDALNFLADRSQCGDKGGGSALRGGKACMKCGAAPSEGRGRQGEALCRGCLCGSVAAKVRSAVKVRGLIGNGDRVLVDCRGDAASQALLHLLMGLRNPDAGRAARGKVNFELAAAHVDAGCLGDVLGGVGPGAGEMEDWVRAAWPAGGENSIQRREPVDRAGSIHFLSMKIEEVCGAGEDARRRVRSLVGGVGDATGRKDLVAHLRTRLLVCTAARLGFNRLARPDCATDLAVGIIADACKGRGFAMASDVHFEDARFGAPVVVKPLREVGAGELAMYCHFRGVPYGGGWGWGEEEGINGLAERFVHGLARAFPSGMSSVLKTGTKLQRFRFNGGRGGGGRGGGSWEGGDGSVAAGETAIQPGSTSGQVAAPLCGLCAAPMSDGERSCRPPPGIPKPAEGCWRSDGTDAAATAEDSCAPGASCEDGFWSGKFCSSCWNQIILRYQRRQPADVVRREDLCDLRVLIEGLLPLP
eukprot:evm.model.scf_695.4 EVM.evm.TU.scf_695.4   scf_695:50383-53477(+)